MAHNDLMNAIEENGETSVMWKFKRIKDHQGPLNKSHPDCKGSSCDVTVEWENGEITDKPLSMIAVDAPIECAKCARQNHLLDLPGWRRLRPVAAKMNKMTQSANRAKIKSVNYKPKCKCGV